MGLELALEISGILQALLCDVGYIMTFSKVDCLSQHMLLQDLCLVATSTHQVMGERCVCVCLNLVMWIFSGCWPDVGESCDRALIDSQLSDATNLSSFLE